MMMMMMREKVHWSVKTKNRWVLRKVIHFPLLLLFDLYSGVERTGNVPIFLLGREERMAENLFGIIGRVVVVVLVVLRRKKRRRGRRERREKWERLLEGWYL